MMRPVRILVLLFALFPALSARAGSIADSRGTVVFDAPPQRIVSLNWALAEQLVELGVEPVGVADTGGYAQWVARPPLPAGVADVGRRDEPNIEAIATLDPDAILIADEQIAFASRLEEIAPVVHFDTFSESHDNPAVARDIYLRLASMLDRTELAEARLRELDARLGALRARIGEAFDGNPPKVTIVRFLDAKRVVIYGRNSMPEAAMNALGLASGYETPNSRWGLVFKPVTELGSIDEGFVMHIEPFAEADRLFSTPLWRAMPFVAENRFHTLPTLWTYGGIHSVGFIAEEIAGKLLSEAVR